MGKKVFVIIGNGFTIDFINTIEMKGEVDVENLFRLGADVKWPEDNHFGFLSMKNCRNLWSLGARPSMSKDESWQLIERIITVANMYSQVKSNRLEGKRFGLDNDTYVKRSTYMKAYKELSQYLRQLFIHYDRIVGDLSQYRDKLNEWGWKNFFEKLNQDTNISNVYIVSYNYDIWLEKLLTEIGAEYYNTGVQADCEKKFTIIKPHGSINFVKKDVSGLTPYKIDYESLLPEMGIEDFQVENDLDVRTLLEAIIPPAGEAARLNNSWAQQLRNNAKDKAYEMNELDTAIVCGLSYWHVDRKELDELLTAFNLGIDIIFVNPNPPDTLDAVLSSLFENYIHYPKSDLLKEGI